MTYSDRCAAYRSLWEETASPPPLADTLTGSLDCDVVIVGGGITGLSTALHLAERGMAPCVLEAHELAWGASGRNGGQVIPGIKHDPGEILKRYGHELGEPLLEMVAGGADTVFDVIARYGIPCDAVRKGWVQPAHSSRALAVVQDRGRQWIERGAPAELLDRDGVAALLGTDHYLGGWIDRRAGSIQPLSYTRGLVKAAASLGATLFERSPVVSLERCGQFWVARTRNGATVKARHALIATNAYTDDLWPKLRQTVIAGNSFIVATDPLDPSLGASIFPGGEVASDSRRLLLYFRRDAQGRFIMGGRGQFPDPSSEEDWAHLERAARLLYPQLGSVPFTYRWAGRVALTRDAVPHVHEPAPDLRIVLGYNGRGVALATQMGRYLAETICTGKRLPYPVTEIDPIPFHGLRRLYIGLGVAYYGLCDRIA